MLKNLSYIRVACISGLLIFGLTILGSFLIGNVYSSLQARGLIEAMAPSLRTLCFAIITAAATIASLMLTTLGFAHRIDNQFDYLFYERVRMIALACSSALVLSVIALLILTIPLTESDILFAWFKVAYYILIVFSGAISGLIVAIIVMLYSTMRDIIEVVTPNAQ